MKRLLKRILGKMSALRDSPQRVEEQGTYPAGHYHSPIPTKEEVLAYVKARKTPSPELPDVKLHKDRQWELLNEYAQYYAELPFPEKPNSDGRYYYDNNWFRHGDAIFLYSFLRKHRPRRIIEVGSGFSSAVMLDTVEGFFAQRPEMTFIEPHPDRLKGLLRSEDENHVRIIDKRIQEVPLELFSSLEAGDLLFVDSSHVLKCGSDLQVLMFDILPHLPSGLFVHFHDVFYPFDYPSKWLTQGRYWNENYFLRAFLAYNNEWSIYFFNTYVAYVFDEFIKEKMPLCMGNSGAGLYIRRGNKRGTGRE